jgi:hypothetical protein
MKFNKGCGIKFLFSLLGMAASFFGSSFTKVQGNIAIDAGNSMSAPLALAHVLFIVAIIVFIVFSSLFASCLFGKSGDSSADANKEKVLEAEEKLPS